MLYVLTAIEDKNGERPVAVVDNEKTASEWVKEGKNHNWIPFDLNDTTGLGTYTPFKPAPGSPAEAEEKKRLETDQLVAKLKQQNIDLNTIVKQMQALLKKRGIGVPANMVSSLLTPRHKWGLDVSRGQDMVAQFSDLMEQRSFARDEEKSHACSIHPQCEVMGSYRECGDGIVSIEFHTSNQEWFADINDEPFKEGTGLEELKTVTNTYGD